MGKKLSLLDKAKATRKEPKPEPKSEPLKKTLKIKKEESKKKEPKLKDTKPQKENGKPSLKKSLLTKAKIKKEEKTETITADNLEETIIIGLIGQKGTGKTKRASDFESLLKKNKRILYFDSEFKSDKIIRRWHDVDNFDIINFTRVNSKTYKTESIETFQQFENEFIKTWIPKLESGNYQYLVIDKGNVFMPFAVDLWIKTHTTAKRPNPRPLAVEYGGIYSILLNQIFYPVINCCRINGIHLILCFNTKGKYKDDKEIGLKENAHEALLDVMDYEFWLELDYLVYCLKHPLKPFWTTRDEDVDFTKYYDNEDFILNGEEINEIKREFKRYADFKEEVLMTSGELIAKKKYTLKKN
jgi:hypothetical protein